MEFIETQKLEENVTLETPFEEAIDQFHELVKPLCENPEDYFVFESIVMPTDKYKYFYVSVSVNIQRGDRTIQIRLEFKYTATASCFVLQNLLWSNIDADFLGKIKDTNVFKYITNEKIKPVDISVYEVDV